jgi:hypothetical protein
MIYYLDSHQRSKLQKMVTKHKPELYPFPRIIDYINYVNEHIVPKQLKYSESYCWGQPDEYGSLEGDEKYINLFLLKL